MSTPAPANSRFVLPPESLACAESLADVIGAGFTLGPAGRLVIGIAGESGSGKSITAASLAQTLNARGVSAATIHQDDYFILPPRTNHEQRLVDLAHVGPHEVDLPRIRTHIAAFREGRDVNDAPLVDYPGNRFISQTLHLAERDVLVVEGTYVLTLSEIDVRIFLEATHDDTRQRRRERNRDIDHPVIDAILGIEHEIIARQRAHAHIVIDRHFAIHTVT